MVVMAIGAQIHAPVKQAGRSPYIPFLLSDWLAYCFGNAVAYSMHPTFLSFIQLQGEVSEDTEILANVENEQTFSIAKISG